MHRERSSEHQLLTTARGTWSRLALLPWSLRVAYTVAWHGMAWHSMAFVSYVAEAQLFRGRLWFV